MGQHDTARCVVTHIATPSGEGARIRLALLYILDSEPGTPGSVLSEGIQRDEVPCSRSKREVPHTLERGVDRG